MGVINKKPYEISIWEDRLKTVEIPETVKFTIPANDTYTYTLPKEAATEEVNISPAEESELDTEDPSMADFSTAIATCQSHIKNIESKIDQLIRIKAEVISSTGKEEREISQKINSIVNSVQSTQAQMDKLIKELKAILNNEKANINKAKTLKNIMTEP